MGHSEGKDGSLIAIRMRIDQKLCSFLTPPPPLPCGLKKTEAGGYAHILIVVCICGIFATVTVLWGTRWVP